MTSYHMSAEEFRANGHALIDWIARYMENVEQYPVEQRAKRHRAARIEANDVGARHAATR